MSDFADKSVSSSARSQEDLQFHNAKERRRNLAINRAFESLKSRVPSTSMGRKVKLSKIKTLRLATAYINFLMTQLEGSEPNSYDHFISVINAELNRKNSYTQRIQSVISSGRAFNRNEELKLYPKLVAEMRIEFLQLIFAF